VALALALRHGRRGQRRAAGATSGGGGGGGGGADTRPRQQQWWRRRRERRRGGGGVLLFSMDYVFWSIIPPGRRHGGEFLVVSRTTTKLQSLPRRSRPSLDPAWGRLGRGRGGAGRHHRPGRPDLAGGPSLALLRSLTGPARQIRPASHFLDLRSACWLLTSGQASQILASYGDTRTRRHHTVARLE
jgi:hypothetical protein